MMLTNMIEVVEPAETLDTVKVEQENRVVESKPKRGDVNWHDYIMSQFEPSELTDDSPNVDGLRRLVWKEIGRIIRSKSKIIIGQSIDNQNTVSCSCSVTVDCDGELIQYTEVADASPINCGDSKYAIHLTSVAATRAESRALRKILMLNRVVAAEEKTSVELEKEEKKDPDLITVHMKTFIVKLCEKLDINIKKFLASGKNNKYESLDKVPYSVGVIMRDLLSSWQTEDKINNIPEAIKGFDKNWNK